MKAERGAFGPISAESARSEDYKTLRDVGTPSGEKTAPKNAFFDPFFYCGSENEGRDGGHKHGLCKNRREVRFIEH